LSIQIAALRPILEHSSTILGCPCDHPWPARIYGEVMKAKAAVMFTVIVILAIGAAALAINTRILDTPSHGDVGRANELLIPAGATPGSSAVTGAPPSRVSPPGGRGPDD
jgi:hypothetical protein